MISAADAVALDLVKAGDDDAIGIVISHDCDLAVDDLAEEPFVEVLIGQRVEKLNEQFTFAKHPRRLVLEVSVEGANRYVELLGARRKNVEKDRLASCNPELTKLSHDSLQILQRWLASRYKRQALPDELVNRLRPVLRQFEKLGKGNAAGIIGFWLDYQPRENTLPPEEPYELWISVVYASDDVSFEDKAKALAEKLGAVISDEFHKDGKWRLVDLRFCGAVSERDFSLRDMRESVEYKLEHISLRAGAAGVLPP